jgi:luciferase family oxidoreductase group 1
MRISVLDQSPISEGERGADALRHTLDLARLADRLGYTRYWVAEHHGTPMLACPSPEVLIGPLGLATARIRVGSGGVMLPHYSPFKVAENFSMLSALCPGRVDLAIGRAPGTDSTTMFALQRDRRTVQIDDFTEQLAELLAYIGNSLPPAHPFARLAALPGSPEAPDPWLLGSSPQSAIWAAELGLPYAFADFINPEAGALTSSYRRSFVPSRWRAAPEVIVAVWVVCAESDEEARRLAVSSVMAFRLLQQGRLIPVPSVERAIRFLEDEGSTPAAPPFGIRRRRRIVGSPLTVRKGLEAVAAEYEADEVMVVTITHDHGARCRSYELIAREFGLGSPQAVSSSSSQGER